ncbi:ankyrin repeat-containing domain protein [Xylaria telfairii]|nr:ankyrin repeat-containing domain protein [Xylaria telfairii]
MLEEAFFMIDGIVGRKHDQLLPTYEAFLNCAVELASELRRPASMRENIDSTAWVLEHNTFQKWQGNHSYPMLSISGAPGSGKTTFSYSMPSILDVENRKRVDGLRELYLVFDFSCCDPHLDIEQNFVMSLAYQCLTLRPYLFRKAGMSCYLVLNARPHSVSVDKLWSLLHRLVSVSDDHRVFLIAVAMDQPQVSEACELSILKKLSQLSNDRTICGRLKIMVTGRSSVKTDHHTSLHLDLSCSEEWKASIQRTLSEKVLKIVSTRPVWNEYVERITKNPCFLHSNYFDTMLRVTLLESTKIQSTKASLTQALKSMESIGSTDRVYKLLLENLENFDMAREALNWVFHATRPLTVSELSTAIALSSIFMGTERSELEPPPGGDIVEVLEDNISWDLQRDLQGIIGKIIKLVGSARNVYFIHNTFQQYFKKRGDLFIPGFHSRITHRCLEYISRVTKHVNMRTDRIWNPSRALALVAYADMNWATHYKLSVYPNPSLDQTVMDFLLGREARVWFERLDTKADKILEIAGGNPLVMATERGLESLVRNMKAIHHPPMVDGWNFAEALLAAIWCGNLTIFELILPMVLPFKETEVPRHCINLAAEYGRTEHAKIILSNMASGDIDALANKEDSPCLIAAKNGHMETVLELLDHFPENAILQTDSSMRTVLHWAAIWGDADALRKLKERMDIDTDISSLLDNNASTVLHSAAAAGSVEAVRFLLEVAKELLEKKNIEKFTALHIAAEEGHIAVVEMLVKAEADIWATTGDDTHSACALELVALAGHLPVFSLLLDQMKISLGKDLVKEQLAAKSDDRCHDESEFYAQSVLTKLEDYFRRSLGAATWAGQSDIVRYILRECGQRLSEISLQFVYEKVYLSHNLDIIEAFDDEGVDILREEGVAVLLLAGAVAGERPDFARRMVNALNEKSIKTRMISFPNEGNVLHFAAYRGNLAVLRELLRHRDAGSVLQDSNSLGDKPLDMAVARGHEPAAKAILDMIEDHRPSRTIFKAIETKQISMVKLLLCRGWEVGCRDEDDNTLLHKAIIYGPVEMVDILLERSDLGLLNAYNNAGDTLLHIAVSQKNGNMIGRLLDKGADPNILNPDKGISPLHLLCQLGGNTADEILEEFALIEGADGQRRMKTDFNLPASDGSTALHYVIGLKDLNLIRILLRQKLNLNAEVTKTGTTPLMAAIAGGIDIIEVIKLLLKVDANTSLDKRDRTMNSALDIAISREEWALVRELIEAGAELNPEVLEKIQTPLYAAVLKNNLSMVEFLLSKGADPNVSGKASLPPLELALSQDNESIGMAILECDRFDLGAKPAQYSFGSYLHAALYTHSHAIIEILIAKCASVHENAPPYGKPIHLIMFAQYTNEELGHLVERLIHIGAKIDDKDLGGRTVLSLSITEYPESDITFLTDRGGSPNIPDEIGATSVHYASQFSSNNNFKILIEKDGDVERKDDCGRSVLYRAAMSGDHEKFMTVLEKLPANCREEHLAAAAYPAVARGAMEIVTTILQAIKFNFDDSDRNGWTILEVAKAYRHEDLIRMIRDEAGDGIGANLQRKISPSAWNPKDIGPRIRLFENNLGGFIQGLASAFLGAECSSNSENTPVIHI